MTAAVRPDRLIDERRIMFSCFTIDFGLVRHLCEQPSALKLQQQIMHRADGSVADGIEFLMQKGTQFAGIAWCGLDSVHVAKVPQEGFFGKKAVPWPHGRKKSPERQTPGFEGIELLSVNQFASRQTPSLVLRA